MLSSYASNCDASKDIAQRRQDEAAEGQLGFGPDRPVVISALVDVDRVRAKTSGYYLSKKPKFRA